MKLDIKKMDRYHKVLLDFGYYIETEDEMFDSHRDKIEEVFEAVFDKQYAKKAIAALEALNEFVKEAADCLEVDAKSHLRNHNKELSKKQSA